MINPEKLTILERTHRLVKEYAEHYPIALATAKPNEKAFSATEIIYHLVDVEKLWHERFRHMKEKEGALFQAMDPDSVALNNRYNEKSITDGLHEWGELRTRTFKMINEMDDTLLSRIAVHPRYGDVAISRILDIMANHDLQHLEQMKRTLSQVTPAA
ncbi:MAG TPA: DinB family protein [Candidatus Kapabacteria bacterium]|nr:DinB family protein [Candidatus Kapabacteria bacterium]